MAKVPFSVTHALPVEIAATRLLAGVPKLEKAIPGGGSVVPTRVGDDGMRLEIGAMGQTITVNAVLTTESVTGTVDIPLMLTMMKSQIADMVETSVARMLAKDSTDAV